MSPVDFPEGGEPRVCPRRFFLDPARGDLRVLGRTARGLSPGCAGTVPGIWGKVRGDRRARGVSSNRFLC